MQNIKQKISAAIILDNHYIAEWQRRSLLEVQDLLDIKIILNCQNTIIKKKFLKHFGYYLVNFFCLRNFLTKKIIFSEKNINTISFDAVTDGAWQSIPGNVVQKVRSEGIKLVIKFGMSLLHIDKNLADLDIISFHHGDPEYFRGRPAAFYEIYQQADSVGTIVQILSNRIDGGVVLAKAHSKLFAHSYKKTVINLYSNSIVLLRKSLLNYSIQKKVKPTCLGKNYSLPNNKIVCIFLFKILKKKISRLLYGLFFEKKWNIVCFQDENFLSLVGISANGQLEVKKGVSPKIDGRYSFYADPFFSEDGKKIRVEALNSISGLGEIIELNSRSLAFESLLLSGQHYSYPYSFQLQNKEYLIPEVASHSDPMLLQLPLSETSKQMIIGLEGVKLVDSSLFYDNSNFYLFANLVGSSVDRLYLFTAKSLSGPFCAHPQNPIVIDPRCARMGGRIYAAEGNLYRFGQNNCFGYGGKLSVIQILELTPELYSEIIIGEFSFVDAAGPHTIDLASHTIVLDFYKNKFSAFAGYRRVMAKIFSWSAF